jgi:hypothetical protein
VALEDAGHDALGGAAVAERIHRLAHLRVRHGIVQQLARRREDALGRGADEARGPASIASAARSRRASRAPACPARAPPPGCRRNR